tara:strand:+ start:545 stop:706 length:162 start_codon:yes stop_codon:yes gene_type:complete
MNWIIDRAKEPSTWAGLAVGCIIISMMTGVGWIALVGCVGAAGALLLKEKGMM